jgi:hypothetical protein
MSEMSPVRAIKLYFSTPERPITFQELKELTTEERTELGEAARAKLAKQGITE